MRKRKPREWRVSIERARERKARREADQDVRELAQSHGADLAHCLMVVRSNAGRGFPVLSLRP